MNFQVLHTDHRASAVNDSKNGLVTRGFVVN